MSMKLIPISHQTFANFCEEHPRNCSIFNSLKWMQIFGENLQCFGISDSEKKLIGGFYLFKDRIKRFTFYRNPPFCPSNGFVFINKAKNPAKRLSNQKSALKLVADKLNELAKKSIVTVSFPQHLQDMQPFYWNDFKVVPRYSYVHKLHLNEGELFDCLSPETRNRVRKAEQEEIVVFQEHNALNAERLIHLTLSRKEAKVDKVWLQKILFEFLTEENSFMIFTRKEEKLLSVSVCIFDSHAAYYLLGGIVKETNNTGAGTLGLWNAIVKAKSLKLDKFDFEGSMLPGVESFFRSFGGELTPYFTVNKASFWKEVILKKYQRTNF